MRGRSLAGLLGGAVAARVAYAALRRRPPGGQAIWQRTNHRGEEVTLLEGPACVVAAGAGLAATPGVPRRVKCAGTVAVAGAGAVGAYDDLAGSNGTRGLSGHLGALSRREVTSGAVKIAGIGATGMAAAALLPPRSSGAGRFADVLVTGAVVAGGANAVNLFDLRPGRALKAGLLAGLPATLTAGGAGPVLAAPAGAAAALLPEDLRERTMLGDTGANALGAVLALGAASGLGRGGRLALLGGLTGLSVASEVVSFTSIINDVAPLRWFDRLGRRAPDARHGTYRAR